MSSLALVMIVRDEEKNIAECLKSAAPFANEVIIVDTGSQDRTVPIAAEFGADMHFFPWTNDFSAARNFALSRSSSDWNLILDADERIEQFDVGEIQRFMVADSAVGRIKIISETMNNEERNETSNYITRFIPKGLKFYGRIHEQVATDLPRVNVPIIVRHDGYLRTDKSSRNIPLLLEELRNEPTSPYYHYQLAKEYMGIGKHNDGLKSFEQAHQHLSGQERYAPNVLVDNMYALMKAKKLNLLLDLTEEPPAYVQAYPDYHYACGIFYLDLAISDPERYLSYVPRIEVSYRRCLQLGETDKYDSVTGTGSFAAWYNLGNFYDVTGQKEKMLDCYRNAARLGYQRAVQRLAEIDKE